MPKEMLLLLLLLAGIRGAWAQTDPSDPSPTQTVCIGREPYLVTDHPNSIYTWSIFPANSGWQINGTSNSITVNWNIPGTYTLTVVERNAQGCDGLPVSVKVTVNPIPNVVDLVDQVVCNGKPTTLTAFTGTIPGTVFNWINNTPSIGLAASGTGNIAAFNAVNAGSAPVVATIVVTPSANGCAGTPMTFTITVNRTTTVDPVTSLAYCKGAATTEINFTSPVAGTTFAWINSAASIGLGASGNGDIASFTAANTGAVPVEATIVVTPSSNGCAGTPMTFTITVNPTTTVDPVTSLAYCNGAATTSINFTSPVAGTTFAWTNSATSIGLGDSGTGNIASFTAVNTAAVPVVATIMVTPTANGCAVTPMTFTITVNPQPAPTITPSINPVCFGNTGTYTTEPGMTNYIWTVIGGSTTGTGTTDNTVTVTWNGTGSYSVSVNYTNGARCSATAPTLLPVAITPLPATSPILHN